MPKFAQFLRRCVGALYVVLFGVNKIPNLIDPDALAGQIPQHAILVFGTGVSGVHNELGDGVLACAGGPSDGANRLSLAK